MDVDRLRSRARTGNICCYKCNGFGHIARDCPTTTGVNVRAIWEMTDQEGRKVLFDELKRMEEEAATATQKDENAGF